MHELSVASAIVDTVLKHAQGRRVSVVSLRLGKLRQVVPDSLSFYFEIVGRDTACAGARLDVDYVDALMECVGCRHRWDPNPEPEHGEVFPAGLMLPQFRCPRCEAAGAQVLEGDDLEVEFIEVEEEPVPAGPGVNSPTSH